MFINASPMICFTLSGSVCLQFRGRIVSIRQLVKVVQEFTHLTIIQARQKQRVKRQATDLGKKTCKACV
jgi:hypothetical protein